MKFTSIYIEGDEQIINDILVLARNRLGFSVNAIRINPKLEEDTSWKLDLNSTKKGCGKAIITFANGKSIGCGYTSYGVTKLCDDCKSRKERTNDNKQRN